VEPKLIVMITTLILPNGEASVNVKPYATPTLCRQAARIEQADPFVAAVRCSELKKDALTLRFKRDGIGSIETPVSLTR
jgi:hypothetical protein